MKDLKGTIASKGKAKGLVHLVITENDFKNFENGEILVASETHPDFVPLMRKAAAVVCNSGGILCHAAIICRELKIPCLTGVNGATKLLKNKELIEIDAEEGFVRRLV